MVKNQRQVRKTPLHTLWLFCCIVEPNTKIKNKSYGVMRSKAKHSSFSQVPTIIWRPSFPYLSGAPPWKDTHPNFHQQLQLILASLSHWLLCGSGYYHVVPSRQNVAVFFLLHCLWFIFTRSWPPVPRQEPAAMGSGASSTPTIWTLLDGGLETIGWWVQGDGWRAAKPYCAGICSLPPTTVSQVSKLKGV